MSGSVALLAFTALSWGRPLAHDESDPRDAAVITPTRSEPGSSTTQSPREERMSSRSAVASRRELPTIDAEHAAPAPHCAARDVDRPTSASVAPDTESTAAAQSYSRAARNAYLAEILDVIRTQCTEADFVQALRSAQDRGAITPFGGLSAREMSETYFVTTLVLGEQ